MCREQDQFGSIRAHPDAGLSQAQQQRLAKQLANKRLELIGALTSLNRKITAKSNCSSIDTADAAGIEEARLRASGLANHYRSTIAEIEGALGRLRNGNYGISEKTGKPISLDRLLIIPWARIACGE